VITPRLATEAALLAARELDIGGWPGAHLGLTRREAELLTLLGEGLSPRQAADKMDLSWQTVRTHTRNLYRKLDVNDRAAAVAVAWRKGLVR
jgi:DNA-binding CsgD family transcriptional regulator